MKYLFFDIESSTGFFGDICEFGYVITDEKLNVLEFRNILMNPNARFDNRIKREILSLQEEEYKSQLDFNFYYDEIKNIILDSDMVFGYSIVNDADYLNSECKNYNLPCIDFKLYDVQKLMCEYTGSTKQLSLEKALDFFNIKAAGDMHNAMYDSLNTLSVLKSILNGLKMSINEILSIIPNIVDLNVNGNVESVLINQEIRIEKIKKLINEGKNINNDRAVYGFIHKYVNSLRRNKKANFSISNKKIAFGNDILINTNELTKLLYLLYDRGAKYVGKASDSDIYVTDDTSSKKLIHVKEAINSGKIIDVINKEKFMKLIKITNDDFEIMSTPCFNIVDQYSKYRKVGNKCHKKRDKESINYLGDYLKEFFEGEELCEI